MKTTQKLRNRVITWGVLTFLTGAGLLFNANQSQVEAIDISNSHLGTFEGSTTFTTCSSTGVQPTLAIELKNQEGSTRSYETSSGSLTISNTKEGATIKSAILKGNTLLNVINYDDVSLRNATDNGDGTYTLKYAQDVNTSYVIPKTNKKNLFKPNTKYLLAVNIIENNTGTVLGLSGINSPFVLTTNTQRNFEDKLGWQFKFFTSNSDLSVDDVGRPVYNYMYFGIWKDGGDLSTSIKFKFMLIEYQNGMENWDIPYFEGKLPVQIPALTITNGEPEQIEDTNGNLIPNPAFKSTAIIFEEEVILRSNGEVYDELDLMTGKLTQRLDENSEVLAKPIVRAIKMKAEPIFKIVNQAEVSMVGTIDATIASVTVPTAPLTFRLNPNLEPDQQFIASEFSLTNDSQAPLTIELKEFVQTTDVLKDVSPDYYEEWKNLTKEESKCIALGLIPQESDSWLTFHPGTYYVAETANTVMGQIKSQSTVDFRFTALHGQAFDKLPDPQYRLTFVFGF